MEIQSAPREVASRAISSVLLEPERGEIGAYECRHDPRPKIRKRSAPARRSDRPSPTGRSAARQDRKNLSLSRRGSFSKFSEKETAHQHAYSSAASQPHPPCLSGPPRLPEDFASDLARGPPGATPAAPFGASSSRSDELPRRCVAPESEDRYPSDDEIEGIQVRARIVAPPLGRLKDERGCARRGAAGGPTAGGRDYAGTGSDGYLTKALYPSVMSIAVQSRLVQPRRASRRPKSKLRT